MVAYRSYSGVSLCRYSESMKCSFLCILWYDMPDYERTDREDHDALLRNR